jgi:hypothetical protein
MSRASAGWLTRIIWCSGVPYGTISAEVVTHRLRLLDWSRFPARVYDETTSNYTLHNYLAKVSGGEIACFLLSVIFIHVGWP